MDNNIPDLLWPLWVTSDVFLYLWQWDIWFASEGLTRLQITKQVELFNATSAQGTIIKSFCDLVLEVKNVPVTIFTKYLDYTNILALTIILLIWPFKSSASTPNIVHPQKDFNNLIMKNWFAS